MNFRYIEIDGEVILYGDFHRLSIRWSAVKVLNAAEETTPHLYLDGKRVAKPWRVLLDVTCAGGGDVSA